MSQKTRYALFQVFTRSVVFAAMLTGMEFSCLHVRQVRAIRR
jgi:hypothetical protein